MTAQFDDGKEDGALRTIGEVSRATGIKTHVLRYWEQHFPMLEPLKRSGGRRYYRSEDITIIETIDRLVNSEGYTIKGAQQAMENDTGAAGGIDVQTTVSSENGGGHTGNGAEAEVDAPAKPSLIDPDIIPASDGGVDSFFGVPAEPAVEEPADTTASDESDEDGSSAEDASISRVEIVARLKSLRSQLAEAMAA